MSEQKTKPTEVSVGDFLATVEGSSRQSDSARLITLMSTITGEMPVMWGPSIIGFGFYHYRYPTGTEGDATLVGFSPRKGAISVYLMGAYFPESAAKAEALLARLGKHKMGKACLYINKLSDIDEAVLGELIKLSIEQIKAHYP